MKKNTILLTIGMALTMTMANAQINVRSDGGVRIGTPPKPTLAPAAWTLTTKGFEVSLGDAVIHTGKGHVKFRDQQVVVGSSGSISYVNAAAITGLNVCLGTSADYAFRVYADEIISNSSQKVVSDRRYKENIEDLEDATSKVMQLRPVSFDLKTPDNYAGDTLALKGKVGFIAQEVQELFPNLVGYIPDADQYVLDYTSFIPYLTQTIQKQEAQLQEQAEKIADQEARLAELELMVSQLLGAQDSKKAPTLSGDKTDSPTTATETAELYQNAPNPFSESTEIGYALPSNIKSAKMVLHTTAGQLLKTYALPLEPGMNRLTIEGGSLTPGMYTYSLVVNNQVVGTKRMVVTE